MTWVLSEALVEPYAGSLIAVNTIVDKWVTEAQDVFYTYCLEQSTFALAQPNSNSG